MPEPLAGLRVLDCSTGIAGAYSTKLLTDLGADVVLIEPASGHALRSDGASPAGPGLAFESLHAGKRSAVLDLAGSSDQTTLRRLLRGYDLIVSGGLSGAGELPFGYNDVSANVPQLVWLAITPFGETGPWSEWRGADLVLQATSGWMYEGGDPAREPLRTGGHLAEYVTGVTAALAAVAAWRHRRDTGEGQYVDISSLEALHSTTGYAPLARSITPSHATRRIGQDYPFAIVACRDGWVGVNVLTPAHWETLCAFMGRPELLDDPRFQTARQRARESSLVTAIIAEWASGLTVDELFAANEWRLPITMIPTLADILESPQHREREFFVPQRLRAGTVVQRPRGPFVLSDAPWPAPEPAPALGAHTEALRREAATLAAPCASAGAPVALSDQPAGPDVPMSGIRVVDLSMWWAGPMSSALLADLGAEVIKVESTQVIDGWRGANVDPDQPQWWERSTHFLGANRNKRAITLNLQDSRGVDLLLRLIRRADVLIENYTPRVMENFGLGYEHLRRLRPELVMISLPAYGSTGPWRDYPGFAFPVEEMAGFPGLTGYADDGVPRRWGNAASDAIAGVNGALAVAAALEHRRQTGVGQWIDLSQVEALSSFLGAALMEFQVSGDIPARLGNRDRRDAPQGLYPCAFNEGWVAIAVDGQEAWHGLCSCLARPEWADDARLADNAGRRQHHDELDVAIAQWTQERTGAQATESLQAAGVPAGPVRLPEELLDDEQMRARAFFGELNRAIVGRHAHGYRWAHFQRTPVQLRRASPTLGEHNREVLGGELGLAPSVLADLEAAGVIGDQPVGGSRI